MPVQSGYSGEAAIKEPSMANTSIKVDVTLHHYCIFFLPFATYASCGDAVRVSILGFPVYRRVGDLKQILWWKMWKRV